MAAVLRRCMHGTNFAKTLFLGRNTISGSTAILVNCQRESWITKAQISPQVVQDRNYASDSSGEYDKLWAAVTGGRGTGRGIRKKGAGKGIDPELLNFDKAGMKWEGFNAPISSDLVSEGSKRFPPRDRDTKGAPFGKKWFERGWSGRKWPGRKIGHPMTPHGEELTNFDSIVIEVRRVSNMTAGGRKKSQRAMVVVGNANGVAGFGVGKGQTPLSAIKQARNRAVNYLYFVERCNSHTIYHNLETRHKKTIVKFFRMPPGYGLRCHRAIKEIAQLLGIKDMRCKVTGPTTPLSLVRAAFQGLISQETHQQLADRTGLNVVELRPECGMRPMIIASPGDEARKRAHKKKDEKADYDLNEIFDPYRGLHRPKHRRDLFF